MQYVKPARGKCVRIPHTDDHLPAAGGYVDTSTVYWRSQLQMGLVHKAPPPIMQMAIARCDQVAAMIREAAAAMTADTTPEQAAEIDRRLQAAARPHMDEITELANDLSETEQAEFDAYGAGTVAVLRAELDARIAEIAEAHKPRPSPAAPVVTPIVATRTRSGNKQG